MPAELPQLTETPALHHDCCCPISIDFLHTLAHILPSDPCLTFSIGSGSGLLEALLLREAPHINLHAVEVSNNVNVYLPDERMQLVRGTWDLASAANRATAWMFVYPRDCKLIQRYIQEYGVGTLAQIVWIGPMEEHQDVRAVLYDEGWSGKAVEHISHGCAMIHASRDSHGF